MTTSRKALDFRNAIPMQQQHRVMLIALKSIASGKMSNGREITGEYAIAQAKMALELVEGKKSK